MNRRAKILQEAEQLFSQMGFRAVSLEEICRRVGIRTASLYHHFPGGKEEVYLAVISRRAADFKVAVEELSTQKKNLEEALRAFGYWYISQPPMNMSLIASMDMPFLSARGKKMVMAEVGNSIFASLNKLFAKYQAELDPSVNLNMMVGTFTTLLFSVHVSSAMSGQSHAELVDYSVRVFLRGVGAPQI